MITLTDEQAQAVKDIFELFKEKTYVTLSGSAGTGKTTTAFEVYKLAKKKGYNCFLTAPTNKAAKVLSEKTSAKAITIHKMLKLVLEDFEDTQLLNQADTVTFDPDEEVFIIVDEASMLSEELMEIIHEMVDSNSYVKILFIGDPYQLNPINEQESYAFSYHGIELKTVLRQQAENPIIQLAQELRNLQINPDGKTLPNFHQYADNEKIIIVDKYANFKSSYIADYQRELSTHMVVWRNSTVYELNNSIREELYGDDAEDPYIVGEEMMLYAPLTEIDRRSGKRIVLLENSALATIKTISNSIETICGIKFPYYSIQLKNEDQPNGVFINMPVFQGEVDQYLSRTVKKAKALTGRMRAGVFSEEFFPVKNFFGSMRHAHAITSHKSQGSTYDSVYVNVQDISLNPNYIEKLRSMYVAITRTSDKVYLFGCRRRIER